MIFLSRSFALNPFGMLPDQIASIASSIAWDLAPDADFTLAGATAVVAAVAATVVVVGAPSSPLNHFQNVASLTRTARKREYGSLSHQRGSVCYSALLASWRSQSRSIAFKAKPSLLRSANLRLAAAFNVTRITLPIRMLYRSCARTISVCRLVSSKDMASAGRPAR
jgi:hypothetical protein